MRSQALLDMGFGLPCLVKARHVLQKLDMDDEYEGNAKATGGDAKYEANVKATREDYRAKSTHIIARSQAASLVLGL